MSDAVKWLYTLIKPYRWRALLGGFLVALTVLFNAGLLATSATLLAKAALMPPLLLLMPYITGVRFFGIFRAVVRYGERLYNHTVAFRILSGLRTFLYNKLEPLVPDTLAHYTEAKMYQAFIEDVDVLKYFYLRVISVPLGTFLVALASSLFVGIFSVTAGCVLFVTLVSVSFILTAGLYRKNQVISSQSEAARSKLGEHLSDAVRVMDELTFSTQVTFWRTRLQEDIYCDLVASEQREKMNAVVFQSIQFLAHFTFLAVLALTAPLVTSGEIQGVHFAMVALVTLASFEMVQQLPEAVFEYQKSVAAANHLMPVVDAAVSDVGHNKQHIVPNAYNISLQQVSFNYHGQSAQSLTDVSLSIPFGSHVAFIGESASGKTTVARLIAALWKPDGGKLWLGDHSYDDYAPNEIRQYVGLLEQEPFFFHATLKENLLLAKPDADDAAIYDVLAQVDMLDKVKSLPLGLNAPMGEKGTYFSGGEKQRLALARMLLKDAPILILDEPFQNLDGLSVGLLKRLFDVYKNNKTIIIITHELNILPSLNFTYLFQGGKILAAGTHDDCLTHSEAYRSLWRIHMARI